MTSSDVPGGFGTTILTVLEGYSAWASATGTFIRIDIAAQKIPEIFP
jgi:hypothetical protein